MSFLRKSARWCHHSFISTRPFWQDISCKWMDAPEFWQSGWETSLKWFLSHDELLWNKQRTTPQSENSDVESGGPEPKEGWVVTSEGACMSRRRRREGFCWAESCRSRQTETNDASAFIIRNTIIFKPVPTCWAACAEVWHETSQTQQKHTRQCTLLMWDVVIKAGLDNHFKKANRSPVGELLETLLLTKLWKLSLHQMVFS